MRTSLFANLLLLVFTGCATSKDAEITRRACDLVVDLSQMCFDQADPEVACEQLRTTFERDVSRVLVEKNMSTESVPKLGDFCSAACDARKNGRSFSDIRQALDCDKMQDKLAKKKS